MLNIIYLPIIFSALVIIRFLLYLPKFLFIRRALIKQDILVRGSFKKANKKEKLAGVEATEWLEENQIEIKQLVLKTGAQDYVKSFMEPIGFSHVQQQKVSALNNISSVNTEIQVAVRFILRRAKGYYKNQTIKNLNPLFWIEFILFLPREIAQYFSFDENLKFGSAVIKVIQLIYWIASITYMYINYVR